NILYREVEPSLNVGEQIQQIVAQLLKGTGHAAGELFQCLTQLVSIASLDDAEHRFRLRQVELAREKCPHGEFARLSGPATGREALRDQEIDQRRRRDQVQLDE